MFCLLSAHNKLSKQNTLAKKLSNKMFKYLIPDSCSLYQYTNSLVEITLQMENGLFWNLENLVT